MVYLQICFLLMDTTGIELCLKYLNYWEEIESLQKVKKEAIAIEDYENCIVYRDRQKVITQDIITNFKTNDLLKSITSIQSK